MLTIEGVKRFFGFIKTIDRRIDSKLAQQKKYMEIATNISPAVGNGGCHGANPDKFAYCIGRIQQLEQEIGKDVDMLIDCKHLADRVLAQIEDVRYRDILEMRHIMGMSWAEIGESLHYENTQIWRLHGRALQVARNILNDFLENEPENQAVIAYICGRME